MNAPLYSDLAHAPAGGKAHWRICNDDVRIRLAHWRPDGEKGTVILCPGRTEYIEKYGPAVGEFTRAGLAVVVNDWRGQGLSDRLIPNRLIGHVDQFGDYQRDVAQMVAYATEFDLPKPWHLVAHSMGGCITLRSLIVGLPVDTVTFSGPMWGIELPALKRAAAWCVTTLANPLPLRGLPSPGADQKPMADADNFAANGLTSDPERYEFMVNQQTVQPDLALTAPSIGWLHGALRDMRRLSKLPSPNLPCLTFVGTDETVVCSDRIGQRMAHWGNGELITVQGGKHEVMMEKQSDRDLFFRRTLEHIGG